MLFPFNCQICTQPPARSVQSQLPDLYEANCQICTPRSNRLATFDDVIQSIEYRWRIRRNLIAFFIISKGILKDEFEQPADAAGQRQPATDALRLLEGVRGQVPEQEGDLQLPRHRRRRLPASIRQRHHLFPERADDGEEEDAQDNKYQDYSYTFVSASSARMVRYGTWTTISASY